MISSNINSKIFSKTPNEKYNSSFSLNKNKSKLDKLKVENKKPKKGFSINQFSN